jgi:hypothetical protein
MPNLHVTDRQVMLYMTRSQQHDQESAAAMAGFSARTARRIDINRSINIPTFFS